MTKYHLSKDGSPKVCRAQNQCPLGGEHFINRNEALKFSEEQLKKQYEGIEHTQSKNIVIHCPFGTMEVKDGDLSVLETRMALINGLCGDLALAVNKKTGGSPYFVTFGGRSKADLESEFSKDPESIINNTTHVVIESLTKDGMFMDAYGQKSLAQLKAFYGDDMEMVEGSLDMLKAYSTGKNDFSNFADTVIQMDRDNSDYDYFDFGS